jgi:hypothetical protein
MRKSNTKLITLIFSIFIIQFSILNAQDTWVQTYQPFGDVDYGPSYLVICQDGGFAVNGYYHIYEPEFNIDEDLAFLMKTDSEGNLLWAYDEENLWFNDHRSKCFVETGDGGFLMAVTSMWGGTAIVKIDTEGNREWDVDGQDLYPHSMARTSDGDIILGGRMNGFPAIRKITENAEIVWEYTYYLSGSGDGSIQSISKTSDDGFVSTGYSSGNGFDAFVLKVDSEGDSLWCQFFDGYDNWDQGHCIIEISNNNIFVVGLAANPWNGPLLWMLDQQGETIWVEYDNAHVGYEQFSAFNTPDDNIIINAGSIYKVDYNYNLLWTQDYAGGSEKSIKFIDNEYMVIPTMEFQNNESYIVIRKTDLQGNITSTDDNEIQEIDYSFLNCYPNPFKHDSTILFNSKKNERITINIFNIKGELIRTLISDIKQSYRIQQLIWDGKDFTGKNVCSGIYCCKLIGNKGSYSIKKITKIN